MKNVSLALLALALLVVPAAHAKELKGVKMDDVTTVNGKELKLNGLGLRTKVVFKVYVGGLYLETLTKDPAVVMSSDQTKRVVMHMMRDLEKKAIVEAIHSGFEKNAGDKMPALKERLDKFTAQIPDLKEGQRLTITYFPGKGTVLTDSAGKEITVEGKDFSEAMFSVWFGKHPVDDDLKEGMLGLD
ncbi:MAG: chalcone isomerase family protein [Myxococcaceae bacterium]